MAHGKREPRAGIGPHPAARNSLGGAVRGKLRRTAIARELDRAGHAIGGTGSEHRRPGYSTEPPSNSEPAVPPEMNDSSAKPSQELDELFPDTPPAADDSTTPPSDSSESAPPANDDSSPDAAPGDATPQSRRGGARRTSYESSSTDTKMHWRRSPRLGPNEPADPRTSGDDARVATVGRGRTPSASQESRTATPTARLTSNPLRGTRTVVPTSANPSQSLADTDNVPTTAEVASGSPSWRGNPLRGSQ